MNELKLNLGSCDRHFEGFLSVDIVPPADIIADLEGPWPWETSSVAFVKAYDVFEHIGDCDHASLWLCRRCVAHRCGHLQQDGSIVVPHPLPLPFRDNRGKRHVMNELWRVLQPGGRASIQVPHATDGNGGFCDPTHATYWTQSDFEYYHPGLAERDRFRRSDYYGVKADFRVVNLDSNGHIRTMKHPRKLGGYVVEMLVELEAVK
jgi:SAM-dependent methyltransferase